MIFTVPKNFKGSFVLNTLNRALSKGMTVSISGNKLYASDVKVAITLGILVPVEGEYGEDQIGVSHDVVLVNKTDRVMVLGETVLNPKGSLLVSKDTLGDNAIKAAIKNGLIGIISKDAPKKKTTKKKVVKKETTKKKVVKKETTKKKVVKKEIEEEVFDEETDQFISGAERQVQAKIWNFREQESIDAQAVPKTPDMISVDEEEDVDFVDEPLEAQKVNVKKKKAIKKVKTKTKKEAVKKAKKKKAVKKTIKKKEKATKKRKVKVLEPVGDKRIPKTQMDAAIELDSRGRPLEKASDTLNHLIDSVDTSEVAFVDDEQAQERYNDRTDMG